MNRKAEVISVERSLISRTVSVSPVLGMSLYGIQKHSSQQMAALNVWNLVEETASCLLVIKMNVKLQHFQTPINYRKRRKWFNQPPTVIFRCVQQAAYEFAVTVYILCQYHSSTNKTSKPTYSYTCLKFGYTHSVIYLFIYPLISFF